MTEQDKLGALAQILRDLFGGDSIELPDALHDTTDRRMAGVMCSPA
jgi:hypothetical protein